MAHEQIITLLEAFFSALQAARYYTMDHPSAWDARMRCLELLNAYLAEHERFSFAMRDGELIVRDDIVLDELKRFRSLARRLERGGAGKITITRGVDDAEMRQFIEYICSFRDTGPGGTTPPDMDHITVTRLSNDEPNRDNRSHSAFLVDEYTGALSKLGQVITSLLDDDVVNTVGLQHVLNTIMTNLSDSYQLFLLLARIKRFDDATYVHSLNVSILAMNFASHLGIAPEACRQIGTAGFLHDLGKVYLDRRVLDKPDVLDEQEMQHVRSHTLLGAQLLLTHVDDIGPLPVIVAFGHHLRYDMQGYPPVRFVQSQHVATGIVVLCDVYDALVQKRAYKDALGPAKVYELMYKDRGTVFAPDLFDEFFRHFGVWPRGTVVQLADGRIAVVSAVNPDRIRHPVVEVVEGGSGLIDLSLAGPDITAALDPRGEGKRYLDLPPNAR